MSMKMHIFRTQNKEEDLRQVLRDARVTNGAYDGYTLCEDGNQFIFTRVTCVPAVSFTAKVKKGMVWVTDAGFVFIGVTMALARIGFDHEECCFSSKHDANIAFAQAT